MDAPVSEEGAGSDGASDNQPQKPTQPGFNLFNAETRLLYGLLRATVEMASLVHRAPGKIQDVREPGKGCVLRPHMLEQQKNPPGLRITLESSPRTRA